MALALRLLRRPGQALQLPGAALAAQLESLTRSAAAAWQSRRSLSSGPTTPTGDRALDIFDREVKRQHRERAAWLAPQHDPLLSEVVERLLDRLEDCRRSFPTAAVISGAGEAAVRGLAGGRGGVQQVLHLDSSRAQLLRTRQAAKNQQVLSIEADDEFLPLAPGSVDLVLCPLGLHWVNDLPGAMAQCRRALAPDGLFLGAMWGGTSLQELRIACALAEQEREGGVSTRVSPLAQVRDAGNLLTRAGLAIPSVDTDEITVHYRDPLELINHLRAMAEGNAAKARRGTLRRDTALATAAIYREMFGQPDGSVPATFQVVFMTGWAPHASQQAPARRGSATVSFEDLEQAVTQQQQQQQQQQPNEPANHPVQPRSK